MRPLLSLVIALPLAAAACGGGQKTTPAAAAADPCTTAADNMIRIMKAQPDLASLPPAALEDLHAVAVGRCRSDAWSATLQQCVGGAADQDALGACAQHFTEEQQQSFGQASMEVAMKYQGGMGGGGYGGDMYGGGGYGGDGYGG